METIHPWLDPLEVRRLAEKLMERQQTEETTERGEPGFGAAFIGFAGATESLVTIVPVIPEQAALAPSVFEAAVAEPPVSPSVEPPPPPPLPVPFPEEEESNPPAMAEPEIVTGGQSPFLDRLRALDTWLAADFQASGTFLLDHDGKVLFDGGNHGRLHFLAKSLAQASRRQGASAAHVHLKISSDSTLEVILVDSEFGQLVLGVLVPQALDAKSMELVHTRLQELAKPVRR